MVIIRTAVYLTAHPSSFCPAAAVLRFPLDTVGFIPIISANNFQLMSSFLQIISWTTTTNTTYAVVSATTVFLSETSHLRVHLLLSRSIKNHNIQSTVESFTLGWFFGISFIKPSNFSPPVITCHLFFCSFAIAKSLAAMIKFAKSLLIELQSSPHISWESNDKCILNLLEIKWHLFEKRIMAWWWYTMRCKVSSTYQ